MEELLSHTAQEALLHALLCGCALLSCVVAIRWKTKLSLLAASVWLAVAASTVLSDAREHLSPGVLPPGSWLTRLTTIAVDPPFRRALEPFLLLLVWSSLAIARSSSARSTRTLGATGTLILALSFAVEVLSLARSASPGLVAAHVLAMNGALVLIAVSLAFALRASTAVRPRGTLFAGALFLFVMLGAAMSGTRGPLIAGAHYYSWFPENWNSGFVGEELIPPVLPVLGKYDSGKPEVFEQHIADAERAGLNLFVFDWWPKNPMVRKRIDRQVETLEKHEKREGLSFAIHYETLALREPGDPSALNEETNTVVLTTERAGRLKMHWRKLAERYMTSPRYLRFDGRPVLFLYATRHLVGPVREVVEEARRYVFEKTGLELYLVADEAYFNVLDFDNTRGVHLMPLLEPNWSRLTAFDALTCYNPYDFSRKEHAGSEGAESFLFDVEQLFRRYRAYASTAGIDFFPAALPGYNDRGVRLKEDHFVVPRRLGSRSFFDRALESWVRPALPGGGRRLFTVTSFNEWNEGTNIEPSAASPETRDDRSGSQLYSLGELHAGDDGAQLDNLANFLKSFE